MPQRSEPQAEQHVEFAQSQRQRTKVDRAAWTASTAHRLRMPRLSAAAFDPGPDALPPSRRSGVRFLADDGSPAATARAVTIDAPGFVRGAVVSSKAAFTPGTLAIRVGRDDVEAIDPRTLHLMRLDPEGEALGFVDTAGFDAEHGYMWGRVATPGTYAVFGLPDPDAFAVLDAKLDFRSPLWQLIVRLFSPTGDWKPLGPDDLSCCILDFALASQNHDCLYAAASDGGVWRLDSLSAYPAQTWVPLTDDQPSLVIACIAVSPSDNDVVYYVDDPGRLWRSTDRGDTWSASSSTSLFYARRLLVHPNDRNKIYVATSSGLFRSGSGGSTWDSNPGHATLRDGDMLDVAMDPGDPNVIFLAQRNVGVLRSDDGGATWAQTLGWSSASTPQGTMIKLAVGGQGTPATRSVAAKLDQEVFLNRKGGKSLSMSGGGAWTSLGKVGGDGYGYWCHVVAIDPLDDDTILAGAQQLYRTTNGGTSWSLSIDYYRPHEDQHRIVFDPCAQGVVYAANDGGVFRSLDSGATWQTGGDDVAAGLDLTRGLVTAQFYEAGVAGDHAVGDAYHQGLLGARSLRQHDWEGIEGHSWEWATVHGDPVRAGRYYVFSNVLWRRTYPAPSSGPALIVIGNFQPTAIAVDRRPGSAVLLAGTLAGEVMHTADGDVDSPTWTAMGGIALAAGDTIVSIAFTQAGAQDTAYALAASGRVFKCADTTTPAAFTEVTGIPQPALRLATSVEDAAQVFAIGSSSVFRTTDGASTAWTVIHGSGANVLPPGLEPRSVVTGPGALYLATPSGVFKSPDAGQTWFPFHDGLPNVQIMELIWTDDDLFAVTHGRGLWHHGLYRLRIYDDLARAHDPDPAWLVALWHAIHGGDPARDAVRDPIGARARRPEIPLDPRRGTPAGPARRRARRS